MTLRDLPDALRPREKLLARGAAALADVELLALILRTGIEGKDVLTLAEELLAEPPKGFGGLRGLLHASAGDLKRIKGLGGPAKRAQLAADSGTPSFLRIRPIGQKFVKPNWNRLTPTKAVKASHHFETNSGLPSTPRASDSMMNRPAKTWM